METGTYTKTKEIKRDKHGRFIKGSGGYQYWLGKNNPTLSKWAKNHDVWNKGLKGWTKGTKAGFQKGKMNIAWKGDKVTYSGIHAWIRREYGKANKCSFDLTHQSKRFHWANISQKYKRDLTDWMQLCNSCHMKYDYSIGIRKKGIDPWKNKRK